MSPNIFGGFLVGPSASQFRHKQRNFDHEICEYTAPPTPDSNAQLLQIQDVILVSLIDHNLQVNMVVWLDSCVKSF